MVKKLLAREQVKQRKLEAGICPRPKGRPKKRCYAKRHCERKQVYEIQRLQMENKLLRDFLQYTGRK